MGERKYIEVRCPHCGKLVAKILHGNTGVIELICTRGSCKSTFYVIDNEVVDTPSLNVQQIFKKKADETTENTRLYDNQRARGRHY